MLPILTPLKARAAPIGAGLIAGVLAGLYLGAAVSKAHYEAVQHKQAVAYATAWQGELTAYAARVEQRDEAAARNTAERAAQQHKAEEVKREIANDPDVRDCEWRDPHRLRIERLYDAYGHSPRGAAP